MTHNEFECDECHRLIHSYPPMTPSPTRCASCQWLDEFVANPVEREHLRELLDATAGTR